MPPSDENKPVTLEAIAERVGTSVMTVSRVLNGQLKGRPGAAARRAERIRQVAEEMGYRRNHAAWAMLKGRFNAVGLIQSTDPLRNQLPPARLSGINEVLMSHGYSLSLSALSEEHLTDEQYVPRMLSELMVDGLIIGLIRGLPAQLEELIDRHEVPAVWINSMHEHDAVWPDDRDAGVRLTRHLIKLGHKRIAYYQPGSKLPEWMAHYSVGQRQQGYRQAMVTAGLKPRVIRSEHVVPPEERTAFFEDYLKRKTRPTAIVTYCIPDALSVYRAAHRLGLQIPEDLSLVSFEDDPPVSSIAMGLTTMRLPERELGCEAVRMLLKKINAPRRLQPSLAVPMTLHEAQSTAAPA